MISITTVFSSINRELLQISASGNIWKIYSIVSSGRLQRMEDLGDVTRDDRALGKYDTGARKREMRGRHTWKESIPIDVIATIVFKYYLFTQLNAKIVVDNVSSDNIVSV